MQFADGTLVFINDDMESIKSIKNILVSFQLLSGLRINFSKSKLYSLWKYKELLIQGSSILKCVVGDWPFTYLEVSVGLFPKKKLFWDPLIRKVERKLTNWKCTNLNMEGRVVLIKAAIDSLPTYWLNIFHNFIGICKKLEAICRNFLWGKYKDQGSQVRKIHLLQWNKVIPLKAEGGLNLTPLRVKNQALLGKWWFS